MGRMSLFSRHEGITGKRTQTRDRKGRYLATDMDGAVLSALPQEKCYRTGSLPHLKCYRRLDV